MAIYLMLYDLLCQSDMCACMCVDDDGVLVVAAFRVSAAAAVAAALSPFFALYRQTIVPTSLI